MDPMSLIEAPSVYAKEIVDGMARAAFVTWWASEEDRKSEEDPDYERGYGMGVELMDVAPKTSREAVMWAGNLAKQFVKLNNMSLDDLYSAAQDAGYRYDAERFGHDLAMRAMGHGVGWDDDIRGTAATKLKIKHPRTEYYESVEGLDEFVVEAEDRKTAMPKPGDIGIEPMGNDIRIWKFTTATKVSNIARSNVMVGQRALTWFNPESTPPGAKPTVPAEDFTKAKLYGGARSKGQAEVVVKKYLGHLMSSDTQVHLFYEGRGPSGRMAGFGFSDGTAHFTLFADSSRLIEVKKAKTPTTVMVGKDGEEWRGSGVRESNDADLAKVAKLCKQIYNTAYDATKMRAAGKITAAVKLEAEVDALHAKVRSFGSWAVDHAEEIEQDAQRMAQAKEPKDAEAAWDGLADMDYAESVEGLSIEEAAPKYASKSEYTLTVIQNNKVIDTFWGVMGYEIVPAIALYRGKYPDATLSIANKSGRVVQVVKPGANESLDEAKPSVLVTVRLHPDAGVPTQQELRDFAVGMGGKFRSGELEDDDAPYTTWLFPTLVKARDFRRLVNREFKQYVPTVKVPLLDDPRYKDELKDYESVEKLHLTDIESLDESKETIRAGGHAWTIERTGKGVFVQVDGVRWDWESGEDIVFDSDTGETVSIPPNVLKKLQAEWDDFHYSESIEEAVTDPASMTAKAINAELDKLDAADSELTDKLIAAGRGHERSSDIRKLADPLSVEYRRISDRRMALRIEIEARYGPGAPRRLPIQRGAFGPRNTESVEESVETAKKMGIVNPNSSGQGEHPDHANHPYHDTLVKAGFKYSHTTPVGMGGDRFTLHHTYRFNPKLAVSVFEAPSGAWMFQPGLSGQAQRKALKGVKELASYIKGATKRHANTESIEEAGSGGPMKIDSVQSMFLATERWILKKLEQLPSSAPVAAQMVEMLSDLRKRVQPHFGKKGAEAVEVFIPAMNEVGFITPAPPLNTLGKKWNLYYDKYASQYRLPKEGLKMKESLDEMKTFAGAVVRPVKTRDSRELLWSVEKNGKLLGSIRKVKNTKASSFPYNTMVFIDNPDPSDPYGDAKHAGNAPDLEGAVKLILAAAGNTSESLDEAKKRGKKITGWRTTKKSHQRIYLSGGNITKGNPHMLKAVGLKDSQDASEQMLLDEAVTANALMAIKRPKMSPEKAKEIAKLVKGATSARAASDALEAANKLIDGFGVEVIEGRGDGPRGYWMGSVLAYLNMGDTYDTTLCYDTREGKFFVGSWGGWYEEYEQEAQNESIVEGLESLVTDALEKAGFDPSHDFLFDRGMIARREYANKIVAALNASGDFAKAVVGKPAPGYSGMVRIEFGEAVEGNSMTHMSEAASFDPRKAMIYFDITFEEDNYQEDKKSSDARSKKRAADFLKLGKGDETDAVMAAEDLAMKAVEAMLKKSGVSFKMGNEGYGAFGNLIVKFGVDSADEAKKIHDVVMKAHGGGDDGIYLDHYMTAQGFRVYPQGVNSKSYSLLADSDEWLDESVNEAMDLDQMEKKARAIVGTGYDFEMRDDYSGRGQAGGVSPFAFTTDIPPRDPRGQKLLKLGLSVDSMGMDFVYYLKPYKAESTGDSDMIPSEVVEYYEAIEEMHTMLLDNADLDEHIEQVRELDALISEGELEAAFELAFDILEAQGLDEATIRKMKGATKAKMLRSRRTQTAAERAANKAARMKYKTSSALRRKRALYGKRYRRVRG